MQAAESLVELVSDSVPAFDLTNWENSEEEKEEEIKEKKSFDDIKSDTESLQLYSDTYPFTLDMRIKNFQAEKEYMRFVRNCERLLRGCQEFRLWKSYIRDVCGENACAITDETMDEVTIDIHHHIPSLFSLVSAVVNKKIEDEAEFCTFDICEEVLKLHYENRVGYIALLKSIHEKFHNGYLTIPLNLIKGNYKYFMDNLFRYLEDDEKEIINRRLTITESNCNWKKNTYGTD